MLRLEHTGSTSAPGLAAKPIVDVVLEVPDSADEASYTPALGGGLRPAHSRTQCMTSLLQGAGHQLEPAHVLARLEVTSGTLVVSDRSVSDSADRALYEAAKRELAARDWKYLQQFADAKSEVVRQILLRAGSDAGRGARGALYQVFGRHLIGLDTVSPGSTTSRQRLTRSTSQSS